MPVRANEAIRLIAPRAEPRAGHRIYCDDEFVESREVHPPRKKVLQANKRRAAGRNRASQATP